jgi:hypothetical protein
MRISTKNQQARPINQSRGPTTGNENTGTKRKDALAEKARTGSEKSVLAQMVTDAVARRGELMMGVRDPAVEPLHAKTNVGRGPTRGNAGKQQKSAAARKGALGASSSY